MKNVQKHLYLRQIILYKTQESNFEYRWHTKK